MKVTIDNHDGAGAVDYSAGLVGGLRIVRALNKPSESVFVVDTNTAGRKIPGQYGRVVVTSDGGVVLFTGYVTQAPAAEFLGLTVTGAAYQYRVTALSDEGLLDQQGVPVTRGSVGLTAPVLMGMLTQRVDPVRVAMETSAVTNAVGTFVADAARKWSENAGGLAAMARASYRVMNGQLALTPVGAVTHTLSEGAGTLDLNRLQLAQVKTLANDVTVCGEAEPQVYVTDVFQGDGTTLTFALTREPHMVTALKGALVTDGFAGAGINTTVWSVNDPGSRMTVGSGGLVVSGGNGVDGGTTLTSVDNVEIGGALVLTAGGVQAGAGSDGYIAALYSGSVAAGNLFAGFHVKQSGGSTVVVCVVEGLETGASVVLTAGHMYSVRCRIYVREVQRVLASYYAGGAAFGGGVVAAGADLVFEVQDTTAGVNQAVTVLYDGAVTAAPASCTLAAINSLTFSGSVQSVTLEQTGSAWVTSQQAGGAPFTRRLGLATIGADCKITGSGTPKVTFYATSTPQAGEVITVTYRTAGGSVARLVNAAAVAAQASSVAGGVVPGVSRWVGSVTKPAARSSADCEAAAQAMLSIAGSPYAAWAGRYEAENLQLSMTGDVWPGDALAVQSSSAAVNASLIARNVTVTASYTAPETLSYQVEFANEWAEELSVSTSPTVPRDVWLPQTAVGMPQTLANLSGLTVSVTSSAIAVNAGVVPPPGGGFEVRRVDWRFGPGADGTLVLRSPVASFSIVREAAVEQYFVRMYDGSTPPNYSRFSSEICVSVPL